MVVLTMWSKVRPSARKRASDIIHYSPRLGGNCAGNDFARLRVERNLAATKQKSSTAHPLRIWADCRRRFAGENGLLHVADCNWKAQSNN